MEMASMTFSPTEFTILSWLFVLEKFTLKQFMVFSHRQLACVVSVSVGAFKAFFAF